MKKYLLSLLVLSVSLVAGFASTVQANDVLLSAGQEHSCAVIDGVASCWGRGDKIGTQGGFDINYNGAVSTAGPMDANGSFANTGVSAIAAGANHSCLVEGGKVYCWGANPFGGQNASLQLGVSCEPGQSGCDLPVAQLVSDTTDTNNNVVFTNANVSAVAVGNRHSCAIAGGIAYCWGLGDQRLGSTGFFGFGNGFGNLAKKVENTAEFTNENLIAIVADADHTCALNSSGEVFCWGGNDQGQLGIPATTASLAVKVQDGASGDTPRFVNSGIKAITAGSKHTCAVDANDRAFCWGLNDRGQLALGNQTSTDVPTPMFATFPIASIDTGEKHTCVVRKDSTQEVRCAGDNDRRQLGLNGTQSPPYSSTLRDLNKNNTSTIDINDASLVATGFRHSCAVTTGRLICWGEDLMGQLGDGGTPKIYKAPADYTVLTLTTADPVAIAALVAFDGTQTIPTAQTYELAAIKNVDSDNVDSYNSALASLEATDAAEVQAMVDAYNAFLAGAGDNTLAAALTASQYEALGLTLTTNALAQTVADLLNIAIANLDSGADIDTFEKLEAVVVRINNLVDFANGTTSVSAPVLSDYALLGMTGLAEANLDSYNSAVSTKGAITGTAIQAAISAYNAVLAGAGQGQSATVTSQQYEDIAVTVTVIPTEVPLAGEVLSIVNSAVGTQAKEASDTVTELRRMAKAADTIIQTATDKSDAGLVEEDFSVLGIVGVRAGNLPDVVTAVEGATASELTSVPAIKAELPNLSDPVSVAALAGFDGEGDAPNKAVYESAGVAGVDEDNVASYNSALATLTIAEDDLDAIQDVVDAYNAILSAVGTTNTSTLGVADFEALGLSVSAASLPLLREVISGLEAADINAIAGLSAVVSSVTKLAGQADGAVTNEAPAAADYTAVGVSGVVAANVSAYNAAVEASGASTSQALQAVVTTINAIAAAANGNPATVPSLAVTDYAAIGVTVPGSSLGLVNSSVGSQGASASNTNTKLSAIVTAVNKILATVGTSGQSSGLTVADFAALGIVGVTDANLDDAISAIAAAEASDVQTLGAIQILLSDVLITPLPVPTLSQWVLILMAALLLMVSAPLLRRS